MRPYILGLNNPQGHTAFYTQPPGCSGHRLWQMVHEVNGIGEKEWLHVTQRNNLLSETTLHRDYKSAARRRGQYLGPLIANRTVVLVGADVAQAMDHDYPPFIWDPNKDWIAIPHPSGSNLFYNNPIHRLATGILLADILYGCTVEAPVKETVS
jgi:hypothetical protein